MNSAARNIEFQADSLFLDLDFDTQKFKVQIHEEYDGSAHTLDEIEVEVTCNNTSTYLYLPADDLKQSDIGNPEFAQNLAEFLESSLEYKDEEFCYNFNKVTHYVSKSGKWEKKHKARFDADEELRLARHLKNQQTIRNLAKFEKDQVLSGWRATPEDVLKVVRTGYANRAGGLFAVLPAVPDSPGVTKTIKRLAITGGPYRGLVSSGFHPWRLVKQKQTVPVDSMSMFYFIHATDEEVLDECNEHELPLWLRILWEIRILLHGEIQV